MSQITLQRAFSEKAPRPIVSGDCLINTPCTLGSVTSIVTSGRGVMLAMTLLVLKADKSTVANNSSEEDHRPKMCDWVKYRMQ